LVHGPLILASSMSTHATPPKELEFNVRWLGSVASDARWLGISTG
jgi:hypothetical protein